MRQFEVEITCPPSANTLFRNVPGRGRVKTGAYKAWITTAGHELNRHRIERIGGPVALRIVLNKGRADLDNMIKPVIDLLVRHDLIDDDRNVVRLEIQHFATRKKSCLVDVLGMPQ